jgi:hypothetical protein
VVPWKLFDGDLVHYESIRGNVSRKSADLIRSEYYNVEIHYEALTCSVGHLLDMGTIRRVKIAHSLRMRFLTYCPVMDECQLARELVHETLHALPDHIRNERIPDRILLYCLSDLVDIVGGGRGPSVIINSLQRAITILETHACGDCITKFSRQCPVCLGSVRRIVDLEWTECDQCQTSYHRKCLSRCHECPVCVSAFPPPTSGTDDQTCDIFGTY